MICCVCMLSCSVLSSSLQTYGLYPIRLLYSWDSPGKNTGVSSHSLPQGIFLTKGSSWPRDLTGSPALPANSLPFEPPGKPFLYVMHHHIVKILCFFLLQAWAFSFTLLYKKSIATVHLGKIPTEMNGGQFYWEIMWCLGESEHNFLLILKDQRKAISWNLQKQQALHCLWTNSWQLTIWYLLMQV